MERTTQPVGPATIGTVKPEFIRISPDCRTLFGLSRSKVYELIATGQIKSVSLRERGKKTGVRLVAYDSICSYLSKLAEAPEATECPQP